MANIIVLTIENINEIIEKETRYLEKQLPDPVEQEFEKWKSPWRKESLENYIPLGWSFGLFEEGELKAYYLAQPLLFFQCQTQSLWLEHAFSQDELAMKTIVEVAVKQSREKHFQRVYLPKAVDSSVADLKKRSIPYSESHSYVSFV